MHLDQDNFSIGRRQTLETVLGGALLASALGGPGSPASRAADKPQTRTISATSDYSDKIRRVIIGLNDTGKSVVVSDELVSPGEIWETSKEAPLGVHRIEGDKTQGVQPTTAPQVDPPLGGTRLMVAAFPPSTDPKPSLQNRKGFHRTETIDYLVFLDGEVSLLLDEQEVKLKAGDLLINRNAFHSWRNDGTVPARFIAVLVRVA